MRCPGNQLGCDRGWRPKLQESHQATGNGEQGITGLTNISGANRDQNPLTGENQGDKGFAASNSARKKT